MFLQWYWWKLVREGIWKGARKLICTDIGDYCPTKGYEKALASLFVPISVILPLEIWKDIPTRDNIHIIIWASEWQNLVRPAKTQIRLRIRAVWSESSLIACAFYSFRAIKKRDEWVPLDVQPDLRLWWSHRSLTYQCDKFILLYKLLYLSFSCGVKVYIYCASISWYVISSGCFVKAYI